MLYGLVNCWIKSIEEFKTINQLKTVQGLTYSLIFKWHAIHIGG